MPLPDAFLDRLARIVPADRLDPVVATFATPQPTGFRVCTLLADEATTVAALRDEGVVVEAAPGIQGAYLVPAGDRASLMASRPYADGHVYLQNVSSQLPALALGVRPGERVLDACAAPGSKTGQIAALMQNEGEVFAVEKVRGRFYKLKANAYAQGAACVIPWLGPAEQVWRREPEAFDRVLLDAPCSTEGRFHTDEPETTRYWSLRKIREMRLAQSKLFFGAVQALRPGGTLVYSTCTFAPEENEGVLTRALRTFGDALEVVDTGLPSSPLLDAQATPALDAWRDRPFNPQTGRALRVLPGNGLEAFFVARLVKHTSTIRTDAGR